MIKPQEERQGVSSTAAAIGIGPRWYTVATLGKDGRYFPVIAKGQAHRPLFDDLEAAKMALATATLQGLDVVLLSFSLVDAEIEATP